MTSTTHHETADRRRPRRAARADRPRVRRPAREGLPRPHRPRPRRPVARPAGPDDDDRPLRLPHRRLLPLHPLAGRRRVRLPRQLPRGAAERADRADLHLRGLPRPGRPGEAGARGPRRRPHPADRDLAGRLLRRPRRLRRQRHGDRRRRGLRAPRRGPRPPAEPTAHRLQERPHGHEARAGADPGHRRRPREGLLHRAARLRGRRRRDPGARCPGGAADAAGLGLLHRAGHRPGRVRRPGARAGQGAAPGRRTTSRRPGAGAGRPRRRRRRRCRTSAAG